MRNALLALTTALLASANVGCGLLFVPYGVTIPNVELQRIRVEDALTGEPLNDATVTMTVCRYSNWLEPAGFVDVYALPDEPNLPWIEPQNDKETLYMARNVGDGVFELPVRWRIGWAQVWLPLPPVLGPWIHHTHISVIEATAPNHATVCAIGPVSEASEPKDFRHCDEALRGGAAITPMENMTVFRLPRRPGKEPPAARHLRR